MLSDLLDLLAPRSCHGCGRRGERVCVECAQVLIRPVGAVRPSPCPEGLPPVRALGRYEGPLRRLLLAHKEDGALALTAPLGAALAATAAPVVTGPLVLCPVPSARSAVRSRGHDHALRLARAAAAQLRARGADVRAAALLAPARSVADQSGLTAAQRAANLRGALRCTAGPAGAVLVVDDVMTTGATLVEAVRALRGAGHEVVGAAVLGATVRRAADSLTEPLHPDREGV